MKEIIKTEKIEYGEISKVEADYIKTKTNAINRKSIQELFLTIISLVVGLVLIIVGLYLFIKNSENPYFIALMALGVFTLTSYKPKIEDFIKGINN